ncbi:hypothetical protein AMELA_G00198800, partial [Ameiurus melas]
VCVCVCVCAKAHLIVSGRSVFTLHTRGDTHTHTHTRRVYLSPVSQRLTEQRGASRALNGNTAGLSARAAPRGFMVNNRAPCGM